MDDATTPGLTQARPARRRIVNPIPKEGEGGLFSQTWFPIALSSEVAAGQVIGRPFLDGRIVVMRGEDGRASVMSAYCPHVGADLSVGTVVGDTIECAFHKWRFDREGWCVATAVGDPPPAAACLYRFPTVERFGIIWAFNGDEPLWSLFDFEIADENLRFQAFKTDIYTCDPWIFAANTPDIQHIKVVHGIRFKGADPHKIVEWEPHGFRMKIDAVHQNGEDIVWNVGIRGTSLFVQEGAVNDWWMGVVAGFSCPRPGTHEVFLAIAVHAGDGSPESERLVQERLTFGADLLARTAAEDKPILDTIHYSPGALTKGDATLARWLEMVRRYPRAHPSRDFIN